MWDFLMNLINILKLIIDEKDIRIDIVFFFLENFKTL